MSAGWLLWAGMAAGTLSATGGAAALGDVAVLVCGLVLLAAAAAAATGLARPLHRHAGPDLPAGVTTALVVVATLGYLVVAPVALHAVGVRLTTASSAVVAMALPAAALGARRRFRIGGRAALGAGALVAALAGAVAFGPTVDRHVGVTTPSTEFSSLSFVAPVSGGVNQTSGQVRLEVVHTAAGGSAGQVVADLDGRAVATTARPSSGGAARILTFDLAVPADGCEHLFEVRAAPVAPGRPAALRGPEATADDAARSTLRLAARFANGPPGDDCP